MLVTSTWSAEDVQDAADRMGIEIKAKEAEDFLHRNEQAFRNQLTKRGNEILKGMLEQESNMRARLQWERFTQTEIDAIAATFV